MLRARTTNAPTPLHMHSPQELGTKQRVSRLRPCDISGLVVHRQGRDPRFEGDLNTKDKNAYNANYAFIDEYKRKDIGDLTQYVSLCHTIYLNLFDYRFLLTAFK